jgi:hypothetical protein
VTPCSGVRLDWDLLGRPCVTDEDMWLVAARRGQASCMHPFRAPRLRISCSPCVVNFCGTHTAHFLRNTCGVSFSNVVVPIVGEVNLVGT